MQPKYSHNASNMLRVPTTPQTHESLCCSEAVDIERLQRCCGTASWRQLADSWKCLIFNLVQCHLWKTTDSVAGVFKCRHRGREHWQAGYLGLKIAVLTARAGLTSCLFQACTVSQFGRLYTSMADSSKSNWPIQLTRKSIVEKDLNSGDICNKYMQSTRHEYLWTTTDTSQGKSSLAVDCWQQKLAKSCSIGTCVTRLKAPHYTGDLGVLSEGGDASLTFWMWMAR